VKQSVRLDELPRNSDDLQCFHSALIEGSYFFHGFLRAKIQSRGDRIIYRKVTRGRQTLLGACAN
jgi:hypothetical protein